MPHKLTLLSSACLLALCIPLLSAGFGTKRDLPRWALTEAQKTGSWQVGIGRRIITPHTDVWLAGWAKKRVAEGTLQDLWVKVLSFKTAKGRRVALITTDHMGMSKTIYERLYTRIHQRYGFDRSEIIISFSHNHSGPCLEDDLIDYYPSDAGQRRLVREYTAWMEQQVMDALREAVEAEQPAELFVGEGQCGFAVNRRDNVEEEVPRLRAEGKPLKGAVDHTVPVLSVKTFDGRLLAVLFGYACHPTTLDLPKWNSDYPGFAQANLEAQYPGTTALFFNTCGGDQNPIPRKTLALCEQYGRELFEAVRDVLQGRMEPLVPHLKTAFSFVSLPYEEVVSREKLLPIAKGKPPLQARWAERMIKLIDEGVPMARSYPYPVQAWRLGGLLLVALGGEAVVDYSLRLKREYKGRTWVCGYANDMVAYIPSRRVWEEGGYEGGNHLDEYGRPAWRWSGEVEKRIVRTVRKLVRRLGPGRYPEDF